MLRLQRDCRHLHSLGPHALSEALLEIADRTRGLSEICETLVEYRRFTPDILRAIGGDRFPPPPLHLVPQPFGVEELQHEPAI
jgi:hypothetical protein